MERMEKQLTAVEWLFENLIELNADMKYSIITWEEYLSKRADLLKEAKAMDKEQIIEAHKQSSIESGFEDSAEDWANEYWERNYGV